MMVERFKKLEYDREFFNRYFWRTYDSKEIDLVEEGGGLLHSYEFKYMKGTVKIPREFLEQYQGSTFELINQENFLDFVI